MTSESGLTYKVYNLAPRTDPCGTPWRNCFLSDRTSSINTRCDVPVKYDLNHARAVPLIPNERYLEMTLFYNVTTISSYPPPGKSMCCLCFCVAKNIKRRQVHCLQLPLIITFVNL